MYVCALTIIFTITLAVQTSPFVVVLGTVTCLWGRYWALKTLNFSAFQQSYFQLCCVPLSWGLPWGVGVWISLIMVFTVDWECRILNLLCLTCGHTATLIQFYGHFLFASISFFDPISLEGLLHFNFFIVILGNFGRSTYKYSNWSLAFYSKCIFEFH